MIQRRTYIKRLTEAEIGAKGMNEIYIRLPNDFDYEDFFQNKGYLKETVIQVDFQAIDVQNENVIVPLRFCYYANSANKEKRIPSLKQLFESHHVAAGDYAELESITENNDTRFILRFHKADETVLKCGKDSQQVYFIQNEKEIRSPQKLIEEQQPEQIDSKNDSYQLIYFGAPGTGKSFKVNDEAKKFLIQNVIRYNQEKRREKFEKKLETLVEDEKLAQNLKDDYIQYLNGDSRFASTLFSYTKIDEIKRELNVRKKELDEAKKGSDVEKKRNKTAFWIVKRYLEFASGEPLFIQHVERVTFHPNYSFAQFVGTYKPIQDFVDKSQIRYEYVPGPFMRAYKRAVKHPAHKILLIIEEINRANVAAVFGDVFQLLDRKNGVSEYPIAASEDIRKYLKDNGIDDCKELRIPSNMYIWATMNSADQGVFPMDTAFKRRWEFKYIDVDHDEKKIQNYIIPINDSIDKTEIKFVRWNALRRRINAKLTSLEINEDKLMGPFFLNLSKLEELKGMLSGIESLTVKNEDFAEDVDDEKNPKVFSVATNSISEDQKNAIESFRTAFCGKVLMYLFEDAAKMRKTKLFNTEKIGQMRFSNICNKFADIGLDIFDFSK